MSWSFASGTNLKPEHLSSLLKYVISNGSSISLDEVILALDVICTNLQKVSNNDTLFASEACRLLISHFTNYVEQGYIEREHLVDIICCLMSGTSLPNDYRSYLCSKECNQITHDTVETVYPCTQMSIPPKELLSMNGLLLFSSLSMKKLVSILMPMDLLDPFRIAVEQQSFSVYAQVKYSDVPTLRNGLNDFEKLLSLNFGAVTERVIEYVSSMSNALILMIDSLACNCTPEEMQTETASACCAATINIHKRATELAVGTMYAKNHLTKSTEVLVYCINELLIKCKLDLAYVLTNRFLNMIPTALPFLTFIPATSYGALWGVAKEALQHALRLGDISAIKKSASTDSSDDPVIGVGDWLESILKAVPVLMDQHEDGLSLQKTTTFTASSITLLCLCERCLSMLLFMQNASNIWTNANFGYYQDLCAASAGDHEYGAMGDVNNLLLLLLEQALDKGYLDDSAKTQLLDRMFHFPKGDESDVITSDPFCLKIAATCIFGYGNLEQIIYRILRSIDGTPEHSAFWLLECVSDLLSIDELKKVTSYTVQMLYDVLKSGDEKRERVRHALEAVHLLLNGGQSCGERRKVMEKFRKYNSDNFDLNKSPKWECLHLTRSMIDFNCWDELHDLYINWLYESQWNELHLPPYMILPPTTSFLLKLINGDDNIYPGERCHFVRIRPLLLENSYLAYLQKFNDEAANIDMTNLVKIEILIAVGLPIVYDCSLIDLVNLPLIYYDSLLLLYKQLRKYRCKSEDLTIFSEFVIGMYQNALTVLCERSKIRISLSACATSLSLARSDMLNNAVPHARGELLSILNDELLKLARAWAAPMLPDIRFAYKPSALDAMSDTFQPPTLVIACSQDVRKQAFAAFCSLCDNTIRFVLNQLLLRTGAQRQDEAQSLLDWMIFIHCSELTTTATRELNQSVLSTVSVVMVMGRHLARIVSTLLDGMLTQQIAAETNLLDSPSIFCSILIHLVSMQNTFNLPWNTIPEAIFSSTLDRIMSDDSLVKRSLPLIDLLSTICCLKNTHLTLRFLSPIEIHPDLLLRWINVSSIPLETFCSLQPLIEYLAGEGDRTARIVEPELHDILERMISIIFGTKIHQQTTSSSLIEVKRSDRWAYASLFWRKSNFQTKQNEPGSSRGNPRRVQLNGLDIFSRTLLVLLNVGGPKMHCPLIKHCIKLFAELLDVIQTDGLEFVKGSAKLSNMQINTACYVFIFLCGILDYIDGLCQALHPPFAVGDDGDDVTAVFMPKHIIKKQPVSSRNRTLPLCTFATTAKQFIQQHWYNCYTCGMIEGEGVCSVCAVNCHRGHDLSYSKHGSFFCDCGAKGCAALKSVSYPQQRRASNQKYTALPSGRWKTSKRKNVLFSNLTIVDEDKAEIENYLDTFMETLSGNQEKIMSLVTAVKEGVFLRSNKMREIRLRENDEKLRKGFIVATNRVIMEPLAIISKTAFDKRIEVGKNAQNMIALLKTGGTVLLAAVQETSRIVLLSIRSVLSPSAVDFDIPRIELDSVGFKIIALASKRDLLAVCGFNQCLIMRINKDGDITERQTVKFAETLQSYVAPKVRWVFCNDRSSNTIAVAALQFIRIFDLNSTANPSSFEFVLPVGDVTELAFGERIDGTIFIIVLSSTGYIYMEELEKGRSTEGASYYLTTTLHLPKTSSAVSMHYSRKTRLLFISMEGNAYVLHFNGTEFGEARRFSLDFPLINWCECAGVLAALSHPSCATAVFLYPYGDTLYMQTTTLKHPAVAQCMLLGPDCVSQLLVQVLENQSLQLFQSCWLIEPDFWVKGAERSMLEAELKPCSIMDSEMPEADMVTIFEDCRPMQKVEFYSKALELVYDTYELTKRINASTMSIVSIKQKEFDIVVRNLDWNYMICALRIEVTPDKCPTSVTVFGKKISLQTKISRLFDIRLTREESLNCNNEVTLNFTCTNPPAQVWSIRVFGKTKKDFGYPTASYRFEQIITLPEQTVASLISVCYKMLTCTKRKPMEWLLPVALKFAALGFEHGIMNRRALVLLKQLMPDLPSYYEQKDSILFSSLLDHRNNGTLQLSIFIAFAVQLKGMIFHRVVSFHQLIKKHFGNVVPFLTMCIDCVFTEGLAAEPVLECLLLSAFVYLAVGAENSKEIIELIMEILFSKDIVIAHRCKCLMSMIISNYCLISVQNHRDLFTFVAGLVPPIPKDKNTSVTEKDHVDGQASHLKFTPSVIRTLAEQIDKERGIPTQLTPSSDLEDYNKEMAWIGQMLLSFVQRIVLCNCDGIRCLAPAQAILFLMGQHAPDQLTDIASIDYLISVLDFGHVQIERSVKAERDQVILHLIYVILVQCTSHNWYSKNVMKAAEADDSSKNVDSVQKSEKAIAVKPKKDAASVPPNISVDDGEDAEADEESDLEQMAGTEPSGDASSSSRDATPQLTCDVTLQQDNEIPTTSNVGKTMVYEEKVELLAVPEPQIALAMKIAHSMVSAGALKYCYAVLYTLKTQWTTKMRSLGQKLSSVPPELQPDLTPLFNARLFSVSPENIFSMYTTLLMDIALRLPYQLKKVLGDKVNLDNNWRDLLCDLIGQKPSTVRRLARKLLLLMCDSNTARYRRVRDEHIIYDLLSNLKKRLKGRSSLQYFELSDIVSRINGIALVSDRRCAIWQKICLKELPWLTELACMMPDVACGGVLNLILLAIRAPEDLDDQRLCCSVVDTLLGEPKSFELFRRLIVRFLLSENEERRWTLHAILRATLQLASRPNQVQLISYLYGQMWPYAHQMGNRAAQLIDLLSCYLARFLSKDELLAVYNSAALTIDSALYTLEANRNSVLYKKLCEFIGSPDVSVLSKSPCLICSNANRPMEQMKLSAIKLDSRFTTSAQMTKLIGHFELSRIIIRLSEIKRSKMVKRFKFYYCNKMLESAVDLKNRPELWEIAADVKVHQGSTEINVQLLIPVVTCNVVLEMAEFYEISTAGTSDAPEFVHCPRCSTSVAPNPGICSNCGENVFQCVKCRAINYDEKEPFLCNSCGFCKYARLEAMVVGRPSSAVQTIEDDNDRKAAEIQMEALLSDIESTRCQIGIIGSLMERCSWDSEPSLRPNMLLKHLSRRAFTHFMSTLNLKEGYTLTSLYRQAQKMHDKLCEQMRRLISYRAELYRYDIENGDQTLLDAAITGKFYANGDRCIGCITALVVHCTALIQAACNNTIAMNEIIRANFIFYRLVAGCAFGDPIAESVHTLIWNLSEVSKEATQKMCELVENGTLPCYLLTKSIFENNFRFWEQKLRCLMRMAVVGNGNTEADLHAIAVFLKICSPNSSHSKEGPIASKSITATPPTAAKDKKSSNTVTEEEYLLNVHEEQCKANSHSSRDADPETSNEESRQEEADELQDLVVDENLLREIMEQWETVDERQLDLNTLMIPSERFPTTGWLQGRFIWSEYAELLKKDESDREHSIYEYIKCCSISDPARKFSLHQWLARCMFSSVAAIRTATYRLLVMMCFEVKSNGEAQVGSPVDIAHVLQRVLLWIRKVRYAPADHIDEFFCLVRTLLTVDEIREVLLSKPVEFHIDIVKRILLASLEIRVQELSGIPGDLSVGILLHHFIQVLNCMIGMNKQGWRVLRELSPFMLPHLLRATCVLKQVTTRRTFYVDESTKELNLLLMRIALKRPILVLMETTRRIAAHPNEPRIQAHLLSIISDIVYPILKKEEDFMIHIEKDSLQEDYLQGRMLGNPYKSSDAGMGPLMRDIKNKICRDCELVALLDDDTGMELLVNQQIIALDLPVSDVYEKIWRHDHSGEPMVIVYRMRGLLGDATEPFVKTLNDTDTKEKLDDSQLRLATALGSPIRAFGTILTVLDGIELTGGGLVLLKELHRLLTYCVKIESNRQQLIECGGIRRFLHVFEVAYRSGIREESIEATALQYLELCRILLVDVLATDQIETSIGGASFQQMSWLLELSMGSDEKLSAPLLEVVTSIAPNLCLGNAESMDALIETFRPCCRWDEIDQDRVFRDQVTKKVETLCKITNAIHDSASGQILKKKMMDAGLIGDACRYLAVNHPPIFNVSVTGPEWKHFLSRPSLKYVLKLMAGISRAHKPSQEAIAENSLPILHRLEQISSSDHIGTLAENVMEELKKNEKVAVQIEKVRQETKAKKRQMAMAMRHKQLSKMGIEIGKKGQLKVSGRKLLNEPHSVESVPDVGVCCICREAVDMNEKIMMVYAFASRLTLRENKMINGRNHSFTTVSQMNLVHMDCHSTAVRMAGSRSEWASAALHNANTKCNVIVPIWSRKVKDSDMEHSFQRLSSDLEVAVDCDTVNLDTLTLDIAELLDRFVQFRSFSALSHGGGRESNMQYMAILILLAQYLRKVSPDTECGEAHSFFHQISISLVMDTAEQWNAKRVNLLRNLQEPERTWDNVKHQLLAWTVVDYYQNQILQLENNNRVQYMRENIVKIFEKCSHFVAYFDSGLSRCENFDALMKAVDVAVDDIVFE